jgi:hypothetical protein
MLSPATITLELSNHEALVLFAFLHRFDDEAAYPFADQAEQRVLWDVECMLEKQLVELFSPDYHAFLAEARAQVRDPLD